jgi:hypothetical protein
LLHEAATKGATIIRGDSDDHLIDKIRGGDIVLQRTAFQKALLSYIELYRRQLLSSSELKRAFVRKMDDVCQICRLYYFAYGSNMLLTRLRTRVTYVHDNLSGQLRNYRFRYNKQAQDGSSKANVVAAPDQVVHGVCFEIDDEDFKKLVEIERGYIPVEVPIYTTSRGLIISKTFRSEKLSNAMPKSDYVTTVVAGAREHDIPEEYIRTTLIP